MKYLNIGTIILLSILFYTVNLAAQNCELIDTGDLRGDEFMSLAKSSNGTIFLGTDKGIYVKGLSKSKWERVRLLTYSETVNDIVVDRQQDAYIASNKGLFKFFANKQSSIQLFSRSNASENDCTSVAITNNGLYLVGTRAGLFFNKKGQDDWIKVSTPFDNKEIVALLYSNDMIFVATNKKAYRTSNDGLSWEEIFVLYSEDTNVDSDLNSIGITDEKIDKSIKFLAADDNSPNMIYLLTTEGVFVSHDSGRIWQRLSVVGLDTIGAKHLAVDSVSGTICVAAKTGLFAYNKDRWHLVAPANNGIRIVINNRELLFLTDKELFSCGNTSNVGIKEPPGNPEIFDRFNNEPSIQMVQQMAIDYAEVGNQKIRDWRKKASMKAALPTLSFGYNNNVYGTSKGEFSVGPNDWDLNVSWDLSELIYNNDQTSIDTRSKLMVELRNDILSEITRLYFERRKLQIELLSKNDPSDKGVLDKKMRMLELTAMIDRLTGGAFSKDLKSSLSKA